MADAAIRRPHLFELEDQLWLPRAIRDAVTDYLQFAIQVGRPYDPAIASIKGALERTGARQVIDLGSGGGGLEARGKNPVPVTYLIGYFKELA